MKAIDVNRLLVVVGLSTLVVGCATDGVRRISVDEYRDKMKGAWIGQSVGVGYGWPTEFKFSEKLIPEDKMPKWKNELVNETFNQDDLYVEMTFIRTLETRGLGVSSREAGIDFANSRYRLWCANEKARNNLRRGIAAPDSSHPSFHSSPDDIDYQIEADFSGILSPGMPQAAINFGETFGRIMNYGDGLWAGQFVGGLYAAAFFSSDRVANVESALACIPSESRYAEMVRDMLGWYRTDPKDWEGAWRKAVDKYGRKGLPTIGKVSWHGIDVKINGAMVLLGYLFGEGDPDRTMYLSTRGGYDSDCNPSTACGVLFTSIGAKNLPARFTEKLDHTKKWEFTDYTYPKLLEVCEKLTRELVVHEGGRIEKDSEGKECFVIPEKKPTPSPFLTSSNPGPVANSRYTPEEMEKIFYAPNINGGSHSTRIRGKDYTKLPGLVHVFWDDYMAEWTLEGYSDIAARKPIRQNDIFWAASNTKGVAAALVLTYVDEGKIGLDDPVEKYFPEWKDIFVNDKGGRRAPKTKPTVRHLLSHMSGLSFFPKYPIDQYSMRELATMAVKKGLNTEPGTNWSYSNWGIDVAAAVVEQVSGKPWEKSLQERILDPLGMKDTTFWPTTNQLARLVVAYHFPDGGEPIRGKGITQFSSDVTNCKRHAEAGGGLFSTAGDFLKFYVMVARRGVAANGKRILSEASCSEWFRNQVPAGGKKQYSFGMDVNPEKGTIGHGGAYATHAEANWKAGTCWVDFVQKCEKPK